MKTEYFSCSSAVSRFITLFILLASLLVLPKMNAAIDDSFTRGVLKYIVQTEEPATQKGTVSVQIVSKNISGDVTIPAFVVNGEISYSVISIPSDAFRGCSNLTSTVIPDSVTSIEGWAFSDCSGLTNIIIPESVTNIGGYAFYRCSGLTSFVIPESITAIANGVFQHCSGLTNIVIPDNVTSIGDWTISDCTSLTNAIIGNGVTTIGNSAFSNCINLKNVTIGNGVTTITQYAFGGCSSLTSVIIPKSVTYIGYRAFSSCSSLTGAYFEGNAPVSGGSSFTYPTIIYYRPSTAGWTYPWDWRPTALWIKSPEITEQPQSQAVMEGDSVTFSVVAEGTEPLSYQWYKEGVLLEGATGASFTIENVGAGDLGNYTVIVSNKKGMATSDVAVLSYLMPPTITAPPVSLTVDDGTLVSFHVEALGADSYQWYRNDIPISGAINALYTIDSVKGTDVGTYKVIVTNRAGIAASSASVTLTQPYRATGKVQVVNGNVAGMTVTDGGWGYTRAPMISIIDETGEGATGHCVIENGVVIQIIIDALGSNYSGETIVLIGSPFNNSGLEITVSKVQVEMNLVLGVKYQLWSSADCINWTQVGESFIAEEEEMVFFFEVKDFVRYFKLQEI